MQTYILSHSSVTLAFVTNFKQYMRLFGPIHCACVTAGDYGSGILCYFLNKMQINFIDMVPKRLGLSGAETSRLIWCRNV